MKRTLRGLRNDMSLTQKEMAKKLGISEGTYVNYESGKCKITYEVVVKICNLCGIDNPMDINFK